MNTYKKYFVSTIKKHFPDHSANMIVEVDRQFQIISVDTRFAATSKNPIDRRLDFSSYFLSLIKVLDLHGESFDSIRNICIEVVTEYVRPKNKLQLFLKQLPVKLIHTGLASVFIKAFKKRVSTNSNPNGFVANIITDKKETYGLGYGFDILECGICKLFKKHHYEKYASILCEVDEITSGFAGLKLIRKGTIAQGSKICDFRFIREKQVHIQ